MKTTKEVIAPCPVCGSGNTINIKEWTETFRAEDKWDGKAKEYRTTPGPESSLHCNHCETDTMARQWHREFERAEFRKTKEWRTPNMLKEHTT